MPTSKKTRKPALITESERVTEYVDKDTIDELTPQTELPKQPEFYKMPRRFGHVPVPTIPLGCDPDKQYYKTYPWVKLPFQKADQISFGHPKLEPNRLIWGDNLHVMRMLPPNSIDLIYIDPPFFSNRDYNVIFGDQNEIRSFTDVWEGGMPSYIIWLNARLLTMKKLLKDTGSIYVHLDSHASHYVKVEMDKIFGYDNFRNEIIWQRNADRTKIKHQSGITKSWGTQNDVILFYGKEKNVMNIVYGENTKKEFRHKDKNGRRYSLMPATLSASMGRRPNQEYTYKGYTPKYGWRFVKESLKKLDEGGYIHWNSKGTPHKKMYEDEYLGKPMSNIWTDISIAGGHERIGYPTQKPEALLERIIKASTKEGDVVADFFCGGGVTPVVAQKLNRRWVACDQSRVAVAVTQGRLESLYEKNHGGQHTLNPTPDASIEYWGTYEIPALEELSDKEFQDFIVLAYGGRTSSTGTFIHGVKGNTPLFVGPARQRSRITKEQVVAFAEEIAKTKGKNHGTMIAWAFAPSAKAAAQKLRGEDNPDIDLIQITLTDIKSNEFKKHVTRLHDEYESFLRFILPPEVVVISNKLESMTYEFDASESMALNLNSKIINVQWDLDFRGRFTPTKGFAFGRQKDGNPLYKVEYKFERLGKTPIACRVQDDLGGEKIHTEVISVS